MPGSQYSPAAKHSQYSFKHLEFLQLQPFFLGFAGAVEADMVLINWFFYSVLNVARQQQQQQQQGEVQPPSSSCGSAFK